MAKFRKSAGSAAIGRDPLGKVFPYLLPVLVFLTVTAISRHFAIGFAAVCLVLSLNRVAMARLRGRVSPLTLAAVLYALVCLLSGLWCHFPAYAQQESVKFIVALAVLGLILARVEREKLGSLLWTMNGSLAIVSLLCIDASCWQLLSKGFSAVMHLLRTGYNLDTIGYEAGIRITGIYSNANVSAGGIAFGLLLSLYLYKTAQCPKGRFAAALTVGVEALAFFLSFSMGAMAAFAVSCLVYVVAARKGERLPLFILMLECVVVTVVCAFAATPFLGTANPLPVLLAFVCGVIIWALDRFVGSKVSTALENHGKVVGITGAALVVLVAAYVVLAFSMTGSVTLNTRESLSRAAYLDAGDYTVSVEGIDPQTRVYSQNEGQLMMHTNTVLYEGPLSQASFAVGEDAQVVWFVMSGDGVVENVTLSDGTELNLGYKLLPAFAANRLQGLKTNQNFIQRLVFFRDSFKLWQQSPIFGWGIGGMEGQLTSVQDFFYETKYAHNHFLQILVEAGIFGIASFLFLLGSALWLLLKNRKRSPDPVFAMLLSCLTMMVFHSLTEVVWSAPMYLPMVFTIFAVTDIVCQDEEKAEGSVMLRNVAAAALWAGAVVFAAFQASSILAEISFRQAEENSDLTPAQFVEELDQLVLLEVYDDSIYRVNAMGNALQSGMTNGLQIATEHAEKLLAQEEFDTSYYVAAYYFRPLGDLEGFFEATYTGLMQEASNADAWNSIVGLYMSTAEDLTAEELEEFLPGVVKFQQMLADFNNSGRMEQIVLEPEKQAFVDCAVSLKDASGAAAQAILGALLAE